MPRALTPLAPAACWISGHHWPWPPPSVARRSPRRRLHRLAGRGRGGRLPGSQVADLLAHSREQGLPVAELRFDALELSVSLGDELLGGALVGDQRYRPVGELALGALDGAQHVAIAARDVCTMVSRLTRSPKSSAPKMASSVVTSSCLYSATARAASVVRATSSSRSAELLEALVVADLMRTAASESVARVQRWTAASICASSAATSAARAFALARTLCSSPARRRRWPPPRRGRGRPARPDRPGRHSRADVSSGSDPARLLHGGGAPHGRPQESRRRREHSRRGRGRRNLPEGPDRLKSRNRAVGVDVLDSARSVASGRSGPKPRTVPGSCRIRHVDGGIQRP